MKKTLWLYTVGICLLLMLSTCRKDIKLPDPSLSRLFGKWEWLMSSGGFSGGSRTPASEGYHESVEFNEKGIYRLYRDGNKKEKRTFSIVYDESGFGKYTILYKDKGPFAKGIFLKHAVSFSGNDTLILDEECMDCYAHVYVRTK